MLRPRSLIAVLSASALLGATAAGCGEDEPDETGRVRATVTDFKTAVEKGDVNTICNRLLSRELLVKLSRVGLPCNVALGALKDVERPKLKILSVRVRGKDGFAEVRTNAEGQPPSEDTIQLVQEAKGWRIANLAGNIAGPPAPDNPAPVPGGEAD